jgi:toxin ParE1/3/4
MRQVIWSPAALDDLGDILDYYAAFDERYAARLVDQIEAAANLLGRYPTGRPGRNRGTFEKSLPEVRYIIAYEVTGGPEGQLGILRVIHSARRWSPDEWPKD